MQTARNLLAVKFERLSINLEKFSESTVEVYVSI
jgi:hypothetical protein